MAMLLDLMVVVFFLLGRFQFATRKSGVEVYVANNDVSIMVDVPGLPANQKSVSRDFTIWIIIQCSASCPIAGWINYGGKYVDHWAHLCDLNCDYCLQYPHISPAYHSTKLALHCVWLIRASI